MLNAPLQLRALSKKEASRQLQAVRWQLTKAEPPRTASSAESARLTYPVVTRLDEVHGDLPISPVRLRASRKRRGVEVLERHEEYYGGAIHGNQVLQQKEFHVSPKVTKQPKKVRVPAEWVTQRTQLVAVMPPNALDCEIKTVLDPWMEAARCIDRHLAADAVSGKYHHAANRVADAVEGLPFLTRHCVDDVRQTRFSRERWNHRIARQEELSQFGPVMQIHVWSGVIEFEDRAARQRFAPQNLVVPTKRRTKGVRIPSRRRVRPKVEGDVYISQGVHVDLIP